MEALKELPEDATWADVEERIHFVAAIERGLEDIRQGKVTAHEDVKQALSGWLTD